MGHRKLNGRSASAVKSLRKVNKICTGNHLRAAEVVGFFLFFFEFPVLAISFLQHPKVEVELVIQHIFESFGLLIFDPVFTIWVQSTIKIFICIFYSQTCREPCGFGHRKRGYSERGPRIRTQTTEQFWRFGPQYPRGRGRRDLLGKSLNKVDRLPHHSPLLPYGERGGRGRRLYVWNPPQWRIQVLMGKFLLRKWPSQSLFGITRFSAPLDLIVSKDALYISKML